MEEEIERIEQMAVSKGSKMELRRGCRDDFIKNAQVVTAKCDPFIVGNIVCVTLEEHDGIYCLDHFSEIGQEGPAQPANSESLASGVSPENVQEALRQLAKLGENIQSATSEAMSEIASILDDAQAEIDKARRQQNRQNVMPRKKRRRRR